MCNRRSVHSRPSLLTCSCFIVLLTHRRIILTTLMHCVVDPSLIHIHTCVDACSNTKEAVSAHLSHSVTTLTMCLTVCTWIVLYRICSTNCWSHVLITSGKDDLYTKEEPKDYKKVKWYVPEKMEVLDKLQTKWALLWSVAIMLSMN